MNHSIRALSAVAALAVCASPGCATRRVPLASPMPRGAVRQTIAVTTFENHVAYTEVISGAGFERGQLLQPVARQTARPLER
jgi:hypothetical protein